MENQRVETDRANSFEFRWGGVGNTAKIYFDTYDQLESGIRAVERGRDYVVKNILKEAQQ